MLDLLHYYMLINILVFFYFLNKDPAMSMTSKEELAEWLKEPITGDLSQIPGIGILEIINISYNEIDSGLCKH
jgi:hypothetical protein